MKIGLYQNFSHRTNAKKKKISHSKCRGCGSSSLVTAGLDQFCCDCDWHTGIEYVDKGYFNNLQAAHREHFPRKNLCPKAPVEPCGSNDPYVQFQTSKEIDKQTA